MLDSAILGKAARVIKSGGVVAYLLHEPLVRVGVGDDEEQQIHQDRHLEDAGDADAPVVGGQRGR